jgi:Tfp pilus assembly protein PilF
MANQKYDELFKLVTSVFEKDGPEAAFSYIDYCIEKTPDSPEIYLIRGEFYLETGNIGEAFKDFEKAIKINPNEPQSYYDRGLLYARTGSDINKALNDFSKAIELDANYAKAYANRANMYLKLRELQKAISDCTKAIELSQDNFEAYFNRGLAYMNMKEFAKALDDYNKVIELVPEKAEAYAKRGFLYSQLGKVQDAIRNYEKFLELDPNNKNATLIQNALKDLRNGKISSTEMEKPSIAPLIIIMTVGTVIYGFIGYNIIVKKYVNTTETLIVVLISAFLGIGFGPFLGAVINFLRSGFFWSTVKETIIEEQARETDKLSGCIRGLFVGLFVWVICSFFILVWALIKSPFIAIFQCLVAISLFNPRVRKFTEFWLGTDAFKNYKT